MNPIAIKYTGRPGPSPGPDRRCFAIALHQAGQATLDFRHVPARPVVNGTSLIADLL